MNLDPALQSSVTIGLIVISLLCGGLGIYLLLNDRRHYRTLGMMLLPFLPSILFFILIPVESTASIEYIGKLGGPIAFYVIVVLAVRRFVISDIAAETKDRTQDATAERDREIESLRKKLADRTEEIAQLKRQAETSRPKPLENGIDAQYRHPKFEDRRIVIRTGDVQRVRDIDVIVNSENTEMMLARIYDSTMSGTLRYLDADIGDDGYIRRDWLNERLQEAVQGLRLPVQVGTVFATRTARLAQSGIKYIFHVAAVHGRVGRGYTPVDDQLDICVQRCFQKFAEIAVRPDEPLESILFPLIGAGAAKLSPQASAEIMLRQVRDSMESDCPQVKTVYLLAYVESHRQAIREAAEKVGLIEVKDAQT